MPTFLPLLSAGAVLAVATLLPKSADAQYLYAGTTTTITKTPTATVYPVVEPVKTVEQVIDLGQYDPMPAAHTAYAIARLPVDNLVLANPNVTYDPCPAPVATYDWDRVFSKSDEFGNSTFGAGYWAGVTFSSRAARGNTKDSFTAEALLKGYVTVFSTDRELARISGKASLTGTQGASRWYVRVLGVDVRSGSAAGNLTGNESLYDAAFLSASKTIWLGPVPVSFTGKIKGTVAVNYKAEYSQSTIALTAKPDAKLYAFASAGVDLWLASAGVSGTLTLVQAGVPSAANIYVQPNSVGYSIGSSLILSSLSGSIDAYATLPGKRWTMNIARWNPLFQGTYPIVSVNSCQNPIVRPVCGDRVCQSGETYTNCSADCAAPPPPPPDDDGDLPLYCQAKPWMCTDL